VLLLALPPVGDRTGKRVDLGELAVEREPQPWVGVACIERGANVGNGGAQLSGDLLNRPALVDQPVYRLSELAHGGSIAWPDDGCS